MKQRHFAFLTVFACLFAWQTSFAAGPNSPKSLSIPMTADRWHVVKGKAEVQFVAKEGFPGGILALKSGDVALDGLTFRDGTIEFDMKALAQDLAGIRFRQQDQQNAEEFYVRSFPDCRAENDCLQYSPVIHGFMLWNVYPQYQSRAPVAYDSWNHIRLVVSGKRMNVYLNDLPTPSLVVGELLSNASSGGLELYGPAAFANFVVKPGKTDGLSPFAARDEQGTERGTVKAWELAPLTPLPPGASPAYTDRPQGVAPWKQLHAERFGIVNLNRVFVAGEQPAALSWLRSYADSDQDRTAAVALGWIGKAWVFVNGTLVTSGENFYYPESLRRNPDGRLSLENGSFSLPLRKGRNEILIALYSSIHNDRRARTAYGWGLTMRFHEMKGVKLAPR